MVTEKVFTLPQTITATWHFITGLKLPKREAANLPDPTLHEGEIIYMPNEALGSQFKGSNGTAWRDLG